MAVSVRCAGGALPQTTRGAEYDRGAALRLGPPARARPLITGLESFARQQGASFRDARLGAIVHPASVTRDLAFSADLLRDVGLNLRALFGPQHGARGEKQDNMIESEHYTDPLTGLPVHSLYGEVRKPTPDMLAGLDAILFDLQDVGVRVYTFIWTMALAMEACGEAGLPFVVLDRPNPVGGLKREGILLRPGFESFVGLHPIPLRHGLTAGELARWLVGTGKVSCELHVFAMERWRRDMSWPDTGLPWVPPSPNLPTPESCTVYPGMVLVEGTTLSEGRGTTKPFEMIGAPWVEPGALAARLAKAELPGVVFRPCHFEPTFQKHAGLLCGGVQLHVTDSQAFRPVRTAVELLLSVRALAPNQSLWRDPPYEYEEELPPIDILWGDGTLREGVDSGATAAQLLEGSAKEIHDFELSVARYLLYE